MFFFITAPYNHITKLTQESEEYTYENFTPHPIMYDALLLDSSRYSFVLRSDDESSDSLL